MIRILQCPIGNMNVGGIETMLMQIYRRIDREKIQFDFLVHSTEKNYYEDEIMALGGKIFRIPFISEHPYRHILELNRFFEEHEEYKIVHIHTTYSIMYFDAKIAKKHGRKVIVHSHNSNANVKRSIVHKVFKRPLTKIADERISCSGIAADWMFDKKVLREKQIKIWNNGITLDEYRFNEVVRADIRSKYRVGDKFVLGSVGRLSEQKNQTFLLEIFAELVKMESDVVLWIVGDGEDRDMLVNKAAGLGVNNRVVFWGSRNDVNRLLQAMDLFIMTSKWEGFCITNIEAQCSGLPALLSESLSEEALVCNNNKLFSLNRTASEWAEEIIKMRKMERQPENYETLKRAGYDMTDQIEMMEDFYLSMWGDICR